jgi:deoxyribodipyrimidine photolyase
MPARTAIVLFTRDLRVTDNPALWAASRAPSRPGATDAPATRWSTPGCASGSPGPEPAGVRGKAIFRPWLMEGFADLGYPEPIVDQDDAVAEFRARRES